MKLSVILILALSLLSAVATAKESKEDALASRTRLWEHRVFICMATIFGKPMEKYVVSALNAELAGAVVQGTLAARNLEGLKQNYPNGIGEAYYLTGSDISVGCEEDKPVKSPAKK